MAVVRLEIERPLPQAPDDRMSVVSELYIAQAMDSRASRWRNGIAIQSPTTYETKIAANSHAYAGGVPEMSIGRNTAIYQKIRQFIRQISRQMVAKNLFLLSLCKLLATIHRRN